MTFAYFSALVGSVFFAAAPLVMASLGETVSERGGVINLSLDGTIVLAAMVSFAAARQSGDPWLGLAAGAATGAAMAAVLGLFAMLPGISELAVGFVLTLFGREMAYFLGNSQARQPGPDLGVFHVPGLADIPVLGPAVFRQSPVVILSLVAVAGIWFFLMRTRPGLVVRCVGESPAAARARGIAVGRVRFWCCLGGGACTGLAGAFYSLAVKPGWGHPQGCEGAGWIALAIVIFGGWRPLRVAIGAFFFAAVQVAGVALQDALPDLSATLLQIAPFPVMIVTLFVIKLRRSAAFREAALRWPLFGRLLPRSHGGPPGAIAGALDRGF